MQGRRDTERERRRVKSEQARSSIDWKAMTRTPGEAGGAKGKRGNEP